VLIPSAYIARAKTVAVVVPSPATSLVLFATSAIRLTNAPKLLSIEVPLKFTGLPDFGICL
jgi:hypothetical protein